MRFILFRVSRASPSRASFGFVEIYRPTAQQINIVLGSNLTCRFSSSGYLGENMNKLTYGYLSIDLGDGVD